MRNTLRAVACSTLFALVLVASACTSDSTAPRIVSVNSIGAAATGDDVCSIEGELFGGQVGGPALWSVKMRLRLDRHDPPTSQDFTYSVRGNGTSNRIGVSGGGTSYHFGITDGLWSTLAQDNQRRINGSVTNGVFADMPITFWLPTFSLNGAERTILGTWGVGQVFPLGQSFIGTTDCPVNVPPPL